VNVPTISQLVRKGRKPQGKKVDTPALRTTWNSKKGRLVELRRGAPQKVTTASASRATSQCSRRANGSSTLTATGRALRSR